MPKLYHWQIVKNQQKLELYTLKNAIRSSRNPFNPWLMSFFNHGWNSESSTWPYRPGSLDFRGTSTRWCGVESDADRNQLDHRTAKWQNSVLISCLEAASYLSSVTWETQEIRTPKLFPTIPLKIRPTNRMWLTQLGLLQIQLLLQLLQYFHWKILNTLKLPLKPNQILYWCLMGRNIN